MTGYYNRQNQRYWGKENPHVLLEVPLHAERVTMWCAISTHGIIPFVVKDKTVNSENYLELLRKKFVPKLRQMDILKNSWFMQDGARPHTAVVVLNYLKRIFNDRVISNRYPEVCDMGLEWSPYSPDLNPCDYFLWGYLKDRVYENNPTNIDELEAAIQQEISRIPQVMIDRAINDLPKRLELLLHIQGGHVEHAKRDAKKKSF